MNALVTIVAGLAGGLAVGGSVVAFFTVLGVVNRIIELSKTKRYVRIYEVFIVLGSLGSSFVYFFDLRMVLFNYLAIPIGIIMGIFVGFIAAALTETLDILSTAVDTLSIPRWLYVIVFAIILGKALGSAIYFLIPGFF